MRTKGCFFHLEFRTEVERGEGEGGLDRGARRRGGWCKGGVTGEVTDFIKSIRVL